MLFIPLGNICLISKILVLITVQLFVQLVGIFFNADDHDPEPNLLLTYYDKKGKGKVLC